MDCSSAMKRKAEEGMDRFSSATKRKVEVAKSAAAGEGDGGVEAPVTKQVTKMPQEEVDRILSRTKVIPPVDPEDCEDEEVKELLRVNLELIESYWDEFSKFQDWVRCEYAAKGFVEVDCDYKARRDANVAAVNAEFNRMLDELGIPEADDDMPM